MCQEWQDFLRVCWIEKSVRSRWEIKFCWETEDLDLLNRATTYCMSPSKARKTMDKTLGEKIKNISMCAFESQVAGSCLSSSVLCGFYTPKFMKLSAYHWNKLLLQVRVVLWCGMAQCRELHSIGQDEPCTLKIKQNTGTKSIELV